MEIKYKLYPYPVLSSYSNDYGTGSFDVAIDIVRDGYDLRIDFLATLTCQSLQDCIKQGVAKFVYHLECAQTGFRTVVQTDKVSEVYTLLNKAVNLYPLLRTYGTNVPASVCSRPPGQGIKPYLHGQDNSRVAVLC